jgi:hypothetical protein
VAVVKLVRSSPLWISQFGKEERVETKWPIQSIHREEDGSVVIMTLKNRSSGQTVTLRKAGKEWYISAIGSWIA